MNSQVIIRILESKGWIEVIHGGSHKQFKHPQKPGRVTVPHPERELQAATILRAEEPMHYIAYLHKDRNSDFGVSFPDFPGCITAGKTLEEARQLATEALSMHVEGMLEDKQLIPEPCSLDDLAKDPAIKDAISFLVPLETPERTVRVNLTARHSQLDEIDRLALASGMTRSAYMVQASIRHPKLSRKLSSG